MITFANTLSSLYTERCGVIPYTVDILGNINFLLGVDALHNELTDMGGGVRKTEAALMGGIRELHEESRGVFQKVTANDLEKCIAIIDSNMKMSIIFLPICNHNGIIELFDEKLPAKKSQEELSKLLWLTQTEFIDCINRRNTTSLPMWSRVQRFLYNNMGQQHTFFSNLISCSRLCTYTF